MAKELRPAGNRPLEDRTLRREIEELLSSTEAKVSVFRIGYADEHFVYWIGVKPASLCVNNEAVVVPKCIDFGSTTLRA